MAENKELLNTQKIEIYNSKASSLIAIEIGTINTRASLFDMVEGRYRFLASGTSPSSIQTPASNIYEGVLSAIKNLSSISGRPLTTPSDELIIPGKANGDGADHLIASSSVGRPLKTIVVGLLDTVSLHSAVKLAQTHYTDLVDTISFNEEGQTENKIDKIINARPELVIISGGTDGGASKSVLEMINTLRMAIYLIPESVRPFILFVGNIDLAQKVVNLFGPLTNIQVSSNIRPSLEVENISVAQLKLNEIIQEFQDGRLLGMKEISSNSTGSILPASQSLGRVIQFFSKIIRNPKKRAVLGIDLGASSTTVAAAFNGDLELRVITKMGIGKGLENILNNSQLKDITRWLMYDTPKSAVVDYIQNKISHPGSLPATPEDLDIEHALAREIIQQSLNLAKVNFPKHHKSVKKGTITHFDPILISGSTITNAPQLAQSLMIVLDSIQPIGIQQIILDKNSLAVALGAAIPVNPILVSQLLLDPVAFLNLGFVISLDCRAKKDTPVLKIRLDYENGPSKIMTINQGGIQKIPLPLGQRAKIYLDPLQRTNLGLGPGKRLPPQTVVGGPLGLIVDARGRPLQFPRTAVSRRVMLKTWFDSIDRIE